MRRANVVRNRGGVAYLMIHTAILDRPDPFIGYPNHWVSFLGNLVIDEGVWWYWDSGNIKFNCYSWGGSEPVNKGEGPFEDYMWGVVTGKS